MATHNETGTVKLDEDKGITLDDEGRLSVGGRLGQDPLTTGIFSPKSITPRNVNNYSMMITEANGLNFQCTKSLGVVTGGNITLKKSAPAGATQYEVANNYANRIICKALEGGYIALNEDQAKVIPVVKVLSVQIDGADYVPDSGANVPAKNIVITTEASANPDATTTQIRGYGSFGAGTDGYSCLAVGQNVSIGGNTTGASATIGSNNRTSGNWAFVAGNGNYNDASQSAVLGKNNINRVKTAFLAGEGHDSSNGVVAVAAVGKFSAIDSSTLFAVGNGTSHTARSNAFEVRTDGIVLKSPNGTKFKISVDDSGNIQTTEV